MLRRSSMLTDGVRNTSEKLIGSADDHDRSLGSESSRFILVAKAFLSLSETTFDTGSDPTVLNDGLSIFFIRSFTVRLSPFFQEFSSIAETNVISSLSPSP